MMNEMWDNVTNLACDRRQHDSCELSPTAVTKWTEILQRPAKHVCHIIYSKYIYLSNVWIYSNWYIVIVTTLSLPLHAFVFMVKEPHSMPYDYDNHVYQSKLWYCLLRMLWSKFSHCKKNVFSHLLIKWSSHKEYTICQQCWQTVYS